MYVRNVTTLWAVALRVQPQRSMLDTFVHVHDVCVDFTSREGVDGFQLRLGTALAWSD